MEREDHSEELDELSRFEETQTEGILAVPGAAEVLHTLQRQNHPWAIVTSAWRKLAEIRIIAAGLPLPKVIVPVDEIRNGKPGPQGFTRAAELLGVAPELFSSSQVAAILTPTAGAARARTLRSQIP